MLYLPADQMLQRAKTALTDGKLGFAEQAARSVVNAAPTLVDGWVTLGRVLTSTVRLDEAEDAFRTADEVNSDHLDTSLARAQLQWRRGNDAEVIRLANIVLRKIPDQLEATILSGMAHRRLGQLDDAIRILKPISKQASGAAAMAWTMLDMKSPSSAIDVLTPHTVAIATQPPSVKAPLFHVLGQAHEATGNFEAAFRAYTVSKTATPVNFAEDQFRAGLKLLPEVFTPELLQNGPRSTVQTSRPVFIAAMPRSGTTLLDRIIAAHPLAAGAGETRALRRQISEWSSTDPNAAWPRVTRNFLTADLNRIATRYLTETTQFGPGAERISDKHLQNWTHVGLIAMAFPDARVIHLQRDPMDIGISCFERLEGPAIPWSTNLKSIGLAIKATESLMAYWKEHSRIKILTVQYEDLVRHQERETRRVIEFLGLPWDDACLAHHDRAGAREPRADGVAAPVAPPPTLGSEQASRPVSDKSIGRAARFGRLLDPLREALASETI
ncbi:MAG: sulfotransferase [Phycisphaerae bacterium]|nr:sulfotransferase [Phycisphaerae bacterium]